MHKKLLLHPRDHEYDGYPRDGLCWQLFHPTVFDELFFKEWGERPSKQDVADNKLARRVCGLCQVRDACLKDSMSQQAIYGIWGGIGARGRALGKGVTDEASSDH